jgi:hypothetical protein
MLSIVSVFLIGYAASNSVAEEPALATCLWVGILLSVIGMALRWTSHRRQQRTGPDYSAARVGRAGIR